MGEPGERGVVGDDDRRIGDGLGVEDPRRARGERGLDAEVRDVDELRRDAEAAEDAGELGPGGPARGRGDDPVAGRDERRAAADRRHAGREGDAVLGALQLGDRPAEGGCRGVVDAAVGVAGALPGQDLAQLGGVVAREGDRLIDRDGRGSLVDPRLATAGPGRETLPAALSSCSCSGMAGCYTDCS